MPLPFPNIRARALGQAWALSSLSPLPWEVAVWHPRAVGHNGPSGSPRLASDPYRGTMVTVEKVSLCVPLQFMSRNSLQRGPVPLPHGLSGGLTTSGEQSGWVHGTSILQMSKTEAQGGQGRSP